MLIKKLWQLRNRIIAWTYDACAIPVAWFAAFALRFNLTGIPDNFWHRAVTALPLVMAVNLAAFYGFGLYRGVWRFASIPDLIRIVKAIAVSVLVLSLGLFLLFRLDGIPRSVLPMFALLLLMTLGGARLIVRYLKDYRQMIISNSNKSVLIVGAKDLAVSFVRELHRNPEHGLQACGLVAETEDRVGREIQGLRILGTIKDIPNIVAQKQVDLIVIAHKYPSRQIMQQVQSVCDTTGVPVKILPDINDVLTGKIELSDLRSVQLEDLLGREPVALDMPLILDHIRGKKILVTGGGGSIGSELCRQLLQLQPEHLVILDNSEFNLFTIETELSQRYKAGVFSIRLIDVLDKVALAQLFAEFQPQLVFHAAAYKHVPLLQPQIRAAINNNIVGSLNLAEMAVAHQVENFVLVSTDKAVRPTNIMGASKRVAEMLGQYFNQQQQCKFITVRFGNVLGSRGSVIPTFQQQLAKGGPITVTDPNITRYFMTIPEACQLILQATAMGQGGEIFVLDMGKPIKIAYLAEQLILLAGKKPGVDVEIKYIGLRPGEKLHEELFYEQEQLQQTAHKKLFTALPLEFDQQQFTLQIKQLQQAVHNYDIATLAAILTALVPMPVQVELEQSA